jgi:hypothetical protein
MDIINIFIGIMLLTLGRKLFWLFVGCIGFAAGFHYAPLWWHIQSDLILLVLALITGILGAILAIFFQKVAIALAGFAAGSYIAINLMDFFGLTVGALIWLPYVIGGLIGAIILFIVFDWALIILSSFAGSSVIVQSIELGPQFEIWVFFGLIILGFAIQFATKVSEKGIHDS